MHARRMFVSFALFAGATVALVTVPSAATAEEVSSRWLLNHLTVKSEHTTGYDRDKFDHWNDRDGDGCSARYEVLIAEATDRPTVGSGCSLSDGRWRSKYDGVTTTDPSTFDIDHVVALHEAWQSGAWRWTSSTRERFANDLGYKASLIAVSALSNRSKGDREPHQWLPPRGSYRCSYMARWVAVKWRWELRVNQAEKTFLQAELAACDWPAVKKPSRPTIVLRDTASGGSGGDGDASTGGVVINRVYFDSPGSDNGSNGSLNDEWVSLYNRTSSRKTLTGWTLRDDANHVYRFPAFSLGAQEYVKVHTGRGSDSGHHLYWDQGWYVWNNTDDKATLRNAASEVVDSCGYTSASAPAKSCN